MRTPKGDKKVIYLKREREEFERTKKEFEAAYIEILDEMLHIYAEKGRTRDLSSPLHHRLSPGSMISLIQAKCRRTESILSRPGWELDLGLLVKMREECWDIANYAAYTAALCSMLRAELREHGAKNEKEVE